MRIEVDIPKEFERDYKGDSFKDFFSRVLCDIDCKGACGNYEKETAEMFINAFDKSKTAYDIDNVVEELEKLKTYNLNMADAILDIQKNGIGRTFVCLQDVIEIVKEGGKNG